MTTSVPTTKPPGEGWTPWMNFYGIARAEPYHYAEVETWREGWTDTRLVMPNEASPYMNVYGLYWRPAGPRLTDREILKQAFERAWRRLAG